MMAKKPAPILKKAKDSEKVNYQHICNLWNKGQQLQLNSEVLEKAILNVNRITNIAKLRSFQYRLLHRAIITNVHLQRWGLQSSEKCSMCNTEKETYEHLFLQCPANQQLWEGVLPLIEELTGHLPEPTVTEVMLNNFHPNPNHPSNMLGLVVKQYIYRARCCKSKVNKAEAKNLILKCKKSEKYIALKNGKMALYAKKWSNCIDYISNEFIVDEINTLSQVYGNTL